MGIPGQASDTYASRNDANYQQDSTAFMLLHQGLNFFTTEEIYIFKLPLAIRHVFAYEVMAEIDDPAASGGKRKPTEQEQKNRYQMLKDKYANLDVNVATWIVGTGFQSPLLDEFVLKIIAPTGQTQMGVVYPDFAVQATRYDQLVPMYRILLHKPTLDITIAKQIVELGLQEQAQLNCADEISGEKQSDQQLSFDKLKAKYRLLAKHPDMNPEVAKQLAALTLQSRAIAIMANEDGNLVTQEQQLHRLKKYTLIKNSADILSDALAEKIVRLGLKDDVAKKFAKEVVRGNADEESMQKAYVQYAGKYVLLNKHEKLNPDMAYTLSTLQLSEAQTHALAAEIATGTEQQAHYANVLVNTSAMRFWVGLNGNKLDEVVKGIQEKGTTLHKIANNDTLSLLHRRALIAYFSLFPDLQGGKQEQGTDLKALANGFAFAWSRWKEDFQLAEATLANAQGTQFWLALSDIKERVQTYTHTYYDAEQGSSAAFATLGLFLIADALRWCSQNKGKVGFTIIAAAAIGFLFHEFQPFQEMIYDAPEKYDLNDRQSAAVGAGLTLLFAGAGKAAVDAYQGEAPDAYERQAIALK